MPKNGKSPEREDRQETLKGRPIPVPSRDDVLRDLKKLAEPAKPVVKPKKS